VLLIFNLFLPQAAATLTIYLHRLSSLLTLLNEGLALQLFKVH